MGVRSTVRNKVKHRSDSEAQKHADFAPISAAKQVQRHAQNKKTENFNLFPVLVKYNNVFFYPLSASLTNFAASVKATAERTFKPDSLIILAASSAFVPCKRTIMGMFI